MNLGHGEYVKPIRYVTRRYPSNYQQEMFLITPRALFSPILLP